MLDNFGPIVLFKAISSFIGGIFLMIGATVEPSSGVWLISIGGALFSVALGQDKPFMPTIFYMFMGVGWGIFGSQMIHSIFGYPQVATSFFASMFGGEFTYYIVKSLRGGSLADFIVSVISAITPFKKK